MSDDTKALVARLRSHRAWVSSEGMLTTVDPDCAEAAATIERLARELADRDALAAENAELREALRRSCIRGPDYAGYERFCCACATGWDTGHPERHAPGCLAAPQEPRT